MSRAGWSALALLPLAVAACADDGSAPSSLITMPRLLAIAADPPVVAVAAVALTGWARLDPIIALVVAANIVWTGVRIVRNSALGLLDRAWPAEQMAALKKVLADFSDPVQIHAVRTRQSGRRQFVSMHVVVPGDWTVARGHTLVEELEAAIAAAVEGAIVDTHLEPLEDPASFADTALDRA